MKKFLIALVLIVPSLSSHAQAPRQSLELWNRQGAPGYEDLPVVADLKLFEFEIGAGANLGRKWGDATVRPGANLFFELRLNRPEPWDFALQFKGSKFTHRSGEGNADIRTTIFSPSLFVDYNIRPSRRTRFFAGVGFGGSFTDSSTVIRAGGNSGFIFADNMSAFAVTPRAGVSLFNFLRVTAEYSITRRDYSRFGFNVGLVLGGSYRSGYMDRRSGKQKFWEDVAPAIIDTLFPD